MTAEIAEALGAEVIRHERNIGYGAALCKSTTLISSASINSGEELVRNSCPINKIIYPVLTFILPLIVRSIPEILAWPWPIGFDPIAFYVPWIMKGRPLNLGLIEMLKGTRLFSLLALAANSLIRDPILTVKVLGPILYAFLGLSMYLFASRALKWPPKKCFFLVLVCSLYFVSLRISWEMYRQMLGTIFLLLTLTAYHCSRSKMLPLIIVFSILTAFSHEIATVILVAILLAEVIRCSMRKDLEKLPSSVFPFLIVSAILANMLYDPGTHVVRLPLEGLRGDWFTLARFILGFLAYCYIFLLPFSIYGALKVRNKCVHYWSISTLFIGSLWPLLNPQFSPPLWYRWIIFAVYPMSIYFVEGIYQTLTSRTNIPKVVKVLAGALVAFIALSAVWYLVAPPEDAFPYFSSYNPYKAYIQSSMLQSTIPIDDIDDVLASLDWISENAAGECVLVLHEAFYPWSLLRGRGRCKVMRIVERNLSSPIRKTFADELTKLSREVSENGEAVYTIWWVDGKGWYNVPSLPNSFKLLTSYGDIAIYTYAG